MESYVTEPTQFLLQPFRSFSLFTTRLLAAKFAINLVNVEHLKDYGGY